MGRNRVFWLLLAGLVLAGSAFAHSGAPFKAAGPLVGISVEVAGQPAPLYPAPDGSGRHYLEARKGCRYLIRLSNRTAERLGVVLTVDGLNVISGQRDSGRGRMYVLDPWRQATVQGWRSSLQDVRRFTFVDEETSYAARSNKANSRMGWIEVSVYREKQRWRLPHRWEHDAEGAAGRPSETGETGRDEAAPSAPEPMPEGEARAQAKTLGRARSYPGTGWGPRAHDPVVLVDFRPAPSPTQRTTLRYEYRRALVALGVLPSPHAPRDRLWERDRGESGFAPPPLW